MPGRNSRPMYLDRGDGQPLALGAPVCLGEYAFAVDNSFANNDLATLLGGTVLADAIAGDVAGLEGYELSFILITVETNNVRISFKGNDPTTNGLLYAKDNGKPYPLDVDDFTLIRIVGQGGTANLKVALFS